jgi:hypothetical protein
MPNNDAPSSDSRVTVRVRVFFNNNPDLPVKHARVLLYHQAAGPQWRVTDHKGNCVFTNLAHREGYTFHYCHYHGERRLEPVKVFPGEMLDFSVKLDPGIKLHYYNPEGTAVVQPRANDLVLADITVPGLNRGSAEAHQITVEADKAWRPAGEKLATDSVFSFSKVLLNAGKETARFWIHSRPDMAMVREEVSRSTGGADPALPPPDDDHPDVVIPVEHSIETLETVPTPVTGRLDVAKLRTGTSPTSHDVWFSFVQRSTEALSFNNYLDFTDALFCNSRLRRHDLHPESMGTKLGKRFREQGVLEDCWRGLSFVESDAYRVLRAATEAFVMVNCGVLPPRLRQQGDGKGWPAAAFDDAEERAYIERRDLPAYSSFEHAMDKYLESDDTGQRMLPYLAIIRRKLPDVPIDQVHGSHEADLCYGIIQRKLSCPCMIELLWNYWHEEAMLVQTMNVLTQRFQNVRASGPFDPLANLAIDPLRPLNNLIWGYINDEQGRLSVARRGFEYDHEYGLRLEGKALRDFRPADSRSRFLEAFHILLRLCTTFYRQDDDTNIKADAFPVLNALKEVHLILSQGAHNQFGDLPTAARVEMLMQQWMLARPEFREFLPTRIMVAYPEPWMDRVDAMKKLQGWNDTSVIHFHNLAKFGEQLLLSIRYGNWSVLYEPNEAFNWARYWRPQVQGYIHAYRAVTGHDLSSEMRDPAADGTLPSVLLRRRLAQQQTPAGSALPGAVQPQGMGHPALTGGGAQQLGQAQPLQLGQQQTQLLPQAARGNPL